MNAVYFSTEFSFKVKALLMMSMLCSLNFFKPFTIGYLNFEPKAGIEIDLLYSL